MKLKTLNDIARCPNCESMDESCVDYQILKEEAIKWYNRSDDDKHAFIKKFFNITDKEIIDAKGGLDE